MWKTQVIIAAAGSGTRFRSRVPKPFVLLKGKALIARSLAVFQRSKAIDSVIVVGHKDYLGRFEVLRRRFKKIRRVVAGGDTRAASVKCALRALDADTDIVLVHDAARPLIDTAMVERLVRALLKHKAAILGVPVKPTVKMVGSSVGKYKTFLTAENSFPTQQRRYSDRREEFSCKTLFVRQTLPRAALWEAQTPQGFHKDILVRAHGRAFKGDATDDAMQVERMGVMVKVVMGDYRNIKITTPEDLAIAGVLIKGKT